jgi:hypothetical protein
MEDLQFKAEWKRGLELRPVKGFRELTVSVSQPPTRFDILLDLREAWIYEFVVEDSQVPASDHFILCVISPDKKRLARLSAYL